MARGWNNAGWPASLVGQHRLARHVADGEDVRVGRAPLRIDGDEPLAVHFRLGILQAQAVAVGAAADRQQDAAEAFDLRFSVRLEGRFDGIVLIGQAEQLGAEMDGGELPLDSFLQGPDEVAVGARQQPVGQLDDRHAAAQGGVDGAHFQADIAAADHQQRFGHVGQLQRGSGIHYPRRGQVETNGPHRPGTAGQDAMLEADTIIGQGRPIDGREAQCLRVFKRRPCADHLHFALAADLCQPGGERGDNLVLLRPQGVEVYAGRREGDAPGVEVFGLGHDLGHVQQGLRRDAAAQQADSAQPGLLLDQGDLHGQVGCPERGRITARSAADDDELCVHREGLGIRDWRNDKW
jgi:hypothetical protein